MIEIITISNSQTGLTYDPHEKFYVKSVPALKNKQMLEWVGRDMGDKAEF